MYQPTEQELLELGFKPQEWEGKIYGYDFESLTYSVGPVTPPWKEVEGDKTFPFWTLGSWYHGWYPETRAEVEIVIN